MNSRRTAQLRLTPHFAVVCAVVLFGAWLRYHDLGRQSVWTDEMFTLQMLRHPWPAFLDVVFTDPMQGMPPLFFVLEKCVTDIAGYSEAALRFLPALFGSLTVAVLYLLLRAVASREIALTAALFLAVSVYHITYSQEVRPYAMGALLVALSAWLLLAYRSGGAKQTLVWFAISNLAGLYTHYWYALFAAAEFAAAAAFIREPVRRRNALLALAAAAVLFLPQVPHLIRHAEIVSTGNWWWADPPHVINLFRTVAAYCGAQFASASAHFSLPVAMQITACAAPILAAVFLLGKAGARDRMPETILALLLFGTLITAFAISFYRPAFYLWYRYPVLLLPLFFALVTLGLARIPRPVVRWAIALLFVVSQGAGYVQYLGWEKANPRAVGAYLDSLRLTRSDLIIRPWYYADLLEYYYWGKAAHGEERLGIDGLEPAFARRTRIVLITLDTPNSLRDWMDRYYPRLSERRFPGDSHMGIRVGEYSRVKKVLPH